MGALKKTAIDPIGSWVLSRVVQDRSEGQDDSDSEPRSQRASRTEFKGATLKVGADDFALLAPSIEPNGPLLSGRWTKKKGAIEAQPSGPSSAGEMVVLRTGEPSHVWLRAVSGCFA